MCGPQRPRGPTQMDEMLKPAHYAAWHRRPNPHPNTGTAKQPPSPFIAGVDGSVPACRLIKDIVRAVGRVRDSSGRKATSNVLNNVAILIAGYAQFFAMRRCSRTEHVIDVEQYFVRAENCAANIIWPNVSPGFGVAVYTGVAPTNHCVGPVKSAVGHLVGTNQIAEVSHWHDQTDMHAVGFDKQVNALFGLSPAGVGGDMAAEKGCGHIQANYQQRPANQCTKSREQAVDAKQFQV